MRLGIVLTRVMRVVGRDQRDPGALRQPGEPFVDAGLLLHAVVLDLEEVVVAEHSLVFAGGLLRACLVTLEQPACHLATEAARERDESLGVLGQEGFVGPGLVAIPLAGGQARKLDEVPIAGQVLDEQDQVIGIPVGSAFFLVARASRDVGLLADDGVDTGGLGLQVEIDGTVEHAVIGERDRRHSGLRREADHLRDPARAVEQTVFGMRMEVDEAHAFRTSLTTASMWKVWGNMSTKATSTRV